jgi:hypothetical protein
MNDLDASGAVESALLIEAKAETFRRAKHPTANALASAKESDLRLGA